MGRLVAIIAAVLVAVLLSSILIVNEGEKAIVSRFGKILKDEGVTRIYEPGLHIKLPMIDKIKFLDSRIQTMDGAAEIGRAHV